MIRPTPRPVRFVPGAIHHNDEGSRVVGPQLISVGEKVYWATGASGHAVCSVTPIGEDDAIGGGALSIMVMAAPPSPDVEQGLALIRTMTPDEADRFADQLKAVAQRMRAAAGGKAAAMLRKVAGR